MMVLFADSVSVCVCAYFSISLPSYRRRLKIFVIRTAEECKDKKGKENKENKDFDKPLTNTFLSLKDEILGIFRSLWNGTK